MKITIFTTDLCAYCKMVKNYLNSKNFAFKEVNLDTNPDQREQVQKYTNALTVPITVIEQRGQEPKVIVGWQPQVMVPILMSTELHNA